MKMKLVYAMILALVTFAFVGCSKDNDEPQTGGSIDVAIGTYKGKIEISNGDPLFNELVTVTKVSNERVKVSFNNKSLKIADREFNVTNSAGMFVQGAVGATGGSFLFNIKEKSLQTQFEVIAAGEPLVTFTGDKQ